MKLNKLYEGRSTIYKWDKIEKFFEENEDLLESENWEGLIKEARKQASLVNFILYYIGKLSGKEPFPGAYYSIGYRYDDELCVDHETGKPGWHFRYRRPPSLFNTQAIFASLKQATEFIDNAIKHEPGITPEFFSISKMNKKTVDNNECFVVDVEHYGIVMPVLMRKAGVVHELNTEIKQDLDLKGLNKAVAGLLGKSSLEKKPIRFISHEHSFEFERASNLSNWSSYTSTNNSDIFTICYYKYFDVHFGKEERQFMHYDIIQRSFRPGDDASKLFKIDPKIFNELDNLKEKFNFDDIAVELICSVHGKLMDDLDSELFSYRLDVTFKKKISLQSYIS